MSKGIEEDARALRMRWDSSAGRELAAKASAWLHGHIRRRPDGIKLVGGRADLRGFAMQHLELATRSTQLGSVEGGNWKRLDFRGATLNHMRWSSMRVKDCLFDGASLEELRVWESKITDTSFVDARLTYGALGTGPKYRRNSWRRINFTHSDMRGAHFDSADISSADFSAANVDNVLFRHSKLNNVRFTGPMHEVLFENRDFVTDNSVGYPMKSVDFHNAEFYDVEFRGSHFEAVRFPSTQHQLLVTNFPLVAEHVIDLVKDDKSESAQGLRAILSLELGLPGKVDSVGVFTREDLVRWRDEAWADYVFDRLQEAERDVGGSDAAEGWY